jgi:hypothetical protein
VVKGFSLCWRSGDIANINGGVSIGHVSVVSDYLLGSLGRTGQCNDPHGPWLS